MRGGPRGAYAARAKAGDLGGRAEHLERGIDPGVAGRPRLAGPRSLAGTATSGWRPFSWIQRLSGVSHFAIVRRKPPTRR